MREKPEVMGCIADCLFRGARIDTIEDFKLLLKISNQYNVLDEWWEAYESES